MYNSVSRATETKIHSFPINGWANHSETFLDCKFRHVRDNLDKV